MQGSSVPGQIAAKQEDGADNSVSPKPSSTSSHSASSQTTPGFNPEWRFYVAFTTLSVITLAVALDATSLSVALPIIADKLHGTAIEAFWSGTSFLLTSTVFQPSFASLSHIFGRKPLILVALVFFTAGAIIPALANNFTVLLAGRSLQGIGGGGILVMTEVVVTDMVPLRLRGQYFSFISMTWAIGSVTGPVVGGAFSQKVSWRWIFWLNLPFAGLGFVLIPIFLRLNFKTSSLMSKLRRVDWAGTFVFIASLTSFLIPITWGNIQYPWDSWRTLVPLIVGFLGLIAFGLYEAYYAPEPMIRLSIFHNRSAIIAYTGTFFHGLVLWSLLYFLPLYFLAVKDFTPILSGVALFPQTFTVAPAAVVVGFVVTATGRYRWSVWAGWFFSTLGIGLEIYLKRDTSTVSWIFLNLISGIGLGFLFPGLAFAVQASVDNDDVAFAVAAFSFFRAFGQTLGVAVGGSVFQNEMKRNLLAIPSLAPKAVEYSRDAAGLVQIIKAMPKGLPERTFLVDAYVDSLRTVWIVMCCLSAFAFVLSFALKGYSLDIGLETEQGFQHKEKHEDAENVQ
ncbi:MAG: hypothetical protein M1814_006719 [Vezdaea aestivalis]|nr:MAG: hypothetical protein M1814_006719 [Vezdaea aestivalis]